MLNLVVAKNQPKPKLPLWFLISTIFLALLVALNTYFTLFRPDPFTAAKIQMFSLSRGESYYGRLRLWRLFAFSDNWDQAKKLEPQIDPEHLQVLKEQFNPATLKARLNRLAFSKSKTTDDWLEIAKIYASLGNLSQSQAALKRAYELDPIRPDVEKLYYSLGTLSLENLSVQP